MTAATTIALQCRVATQSHGPFLRAVYASTRADELAQVPWPDEQKQAFLELQFSVQDAHYRTYYPTALFLVVECEGAAVGRLYVDQWASEIRIMDISLLPEYRGKGIGTQLFTRLQEEAALHGKALSIHVDKHNPALRLYQRLGFHTKQDKGMYLLMEWSGERPSVA